MSGATTGKVGIMNSDEQFYINQRVGIVRCKDDKIPVDYLKHYLISKTNKILSDASGCAQPNISPKMLDTYPIKDLKIDKMSEIAYKLTKITDLIQKNKILLQKYDQLVKSQFVEMFGDISLSPQLDNWKELADIGEIVGGSTPKTDNKEFWNGNFNWFTPAEISENDFYVFESERKITDKGAQSCSLKKMPINTVILSSRAPIGKVAIAGEEFYCNQGFKNIICGEQVNHIYLYTLLKNNNAYLNSLGRGATFKEISKSIVSKIRIPVPTIDRQNQFADFVKHIDKLKLNDILMEVA